MKFIATMLLCLAALLSAACQGDNFEAFIKDKSGNYARPAVYNTSDWRMLW